MVSPQCQKVKNVGNAHLVDQGVTNWPVMTLCLVSHRWLGIGYVAYRGIGMWGYRPVGITVAGSLHRPLAN